jgi:hypothetical protein
LFHSRIALTPEYRAARNVALLQGAALLLAGVSLYGFALYHLGDIFAAIAGGR